MRNKLARVEVISERHRPAHPHSFLLRRRNFVPNPLSCNLSFELCEGEQDVEGEPAHGRRCIELLCHRDEGNSFCVKGFHNLGEVRQAARETIYLIYDDNVDLIGLDIFQQLLQSWSLQGSAGVSAVVITSRQCPPAFVSLAENEGLAGFSLGIERVEGLLETFF